MTQGVFVAGGRPKYKKDLKSAVAERPERVALEATSWFGNEYGGPILSAPDGTYVVVGPNPHNSRRWYASITKVGDKITVK